jgi:hypothetical protein
VAAFAYAFAYLLIFSAHAAFFYFSYLAVYNEFISSDEALITIFVLLFTAINCFLTMMVDNDSLVGQKVATKIFTIMDTPSEINAI